MPTTLTPTQALAHMVICPLDRDSRGSRLVDIHTTATPRTSDIRDRRITDGSNPARTVSRLAALAPAVITQQVVAARADQ